MAWAGEISTLRGGQPRKAGLGGEQRAGPGPGAGEGCGEASGTDLCSDMSPSESGAWQQSPGPCGGPGGVLKGPGRHRLARPGSVCCAPPDKGSALGPVLCAQRGESLRLFCLCPQGGVGAEIQGLDGETLPRVVGLWVETLATAWRLPLGPSLLAPLVPRTAPPNSQGPPPDELLPTSEEWVERGPQGSPHAAPAKEARSSRSTVNQPRVRPGPGLGRGAWMTVSPERRSCFPAQEARFPQTLPTYRSHQLTEAACGRLLWGWHSR